MDRAGAAGGAEIVHDLQAVFGERLEAVVAYGPVTGAQASSLALVRTLTIDDLVACAARARHWHQRGTATPLLLTRDEFARSLDAFPIEYGEILDHRRILFGDDPFTGLSIRPEDVRRACEVQAKSLLVHLRENYIECGGRPRAVASLVADSAPAFAAILRRLARLDHHGADSATDLGIYAAGRPGLGAQVVGDVLALAGDRAGAAVDAARIFPDYLATVERLTRFVDHWTPS